VPVIAGAGDHMGASAGIGATGRPRRPATYWTTLPIAATASETPRPKAIAYSALLVERPPR
jgi:hypothetical protein